MIAAPAIQLSRLAILGVASAALLGVQHAAAKQTREVQLITPPQAKYPTLAEWLGMEGHCEVRFAVDENGNPFAVEPACTLRIF